MPAAKYINNEGAGAVPEAVTGPFSGKNNSDLGLLRSLGPALQPGDVMLADALYCNYFLIATLTAAGVDVLFELNWGRWCIRHRQDAAVVAEASL